ncbi:hypothetical protein BDZ91DRAFT_747019 [Kalaharituber pfeilii]|nr:hypothetical protein BDZ91DRAFT_747019 [Kalaharituber pfeilii]
MTTQKHDPTSLQFLRTDFFKIILKDVVPQNREESAATTVHTGPKTSTVPPKGVFYVHKSLLASLSAELDKHVNNDMKEGAEGVMELGEVDEPTIIAFLQWAYKDDYTIENPKAASSLLTHTKIYALADRFNTVSLKDLSYNKITALLADLGMVAAADDVKAVMAAVSYAFDNLLFSSSSSSNATATDRLLKYFAHYTAWALDVFRKNAEFCSLLKHSPDFAEALVTNSRSAPIAPWVAAIIDDKGGAQGALGLTGTFTGDTNHILSRYCASCGYKGVAYISCPSCGAADQEIGCKIHLHGSVLGVLGQDRLSGTKTSFDFECSCCQKVNTISSSSRTYLCCRKCRNYNYLQLT